MQVKTNKLTKSKITIIILENVIFVGKFIISYYSVKPSLMTE